MVHIKRFMLPFPNLISIEEFRHHARALFTLLRKASRSASYCSSRLLVSPWQLEYITSRNAQSFYLRLLVFHYGALSSSSPPRTHDVSVVDTSLIYYGYISNIRPAVSWKSNCTFASRYFNKFLPLRIISGGLSIWSLLGIDCAAAPHS